MHLQPGDPQHIGPYRLLGRLGHGGMGTVYLGEDASGQHVAVKVINPEYSRHDQFRARFRREADAARRVRRFCTAAVLDAALDGDQLYVVTEYVPGQSLEEAVRGAGPMRGSSLDALAVGVATALTAIHGAGVIHRDLKPSNVLLSPVGPRVIDFGIARALDTLGGITGTGEIVGTPRYMAPEALRGEPISPACDVFSWGCLVAFAATGVPPFGGDTLPAVLYQVLNTDPPLDGLEPGLRELVAQALAKDPALRPPAPRLVDQMVGRVTPETAQYSVAQAWQAQPPAQNLPPTLAATAPATTGPATAGLPPAGSPGMPPTISPTLSSPTLSPTAAPGVSPLLPAGPSPTAPSTMAQTSPGQGGPPHDDPARRQRAGWPRDRRLKIAGAATVAVVVLAIVGLRVLFGSDGPPDDLRLLYQDDFNDSGTGWDGSSYTGKPGGTYGYALGGTYAIDVTGDDNERVAKAPIPFVPAQPATPDPSASPTPTTPARLLLGVNTRIKEGSGGEYGLYCRGTDDYKASRYEFLIDAKGNARIRGVVNGAGGDLAGPVSVGPLDDTTLLQAECSPAPDGGVRLTMWVDGDQTLTTVNRSGLANGDVGLLARVDEGGKDTLKMRFDNFKLSGSAPEKPN
jgi:serine/threonine protein kinase